MKRITAYAAITFTMAIILSACSSGPKVSKELAVGGDVLSSEEGLTELTGTQKENAEKAFRDKFTGLEITSSDVVYKVIANVKTKGEGISMTVSADMSVPSLHSGDTTYSHSIGSVNIFGMDVEMDQEIYTVVQSDGSSVKYSIDNKPIDFFGTGPEDPVWTKEILEKDETKNNSEAFLNNMENSEMLGIYRNKESKDYLFKISANVDNISADSNDMLSSFAGGDVSGKTTIYITTDEGLALRGMYIPLDDILASEESVSGTGEMTIRINSINKPVELQIPAEALAAE